MTSTDKWFAAEDGYFKGGTELILVKDMGERGGVFNGIRVSQGPPNEVLHEGMEYRTDRLIPWDQAFELEVFEETDATYTIESAQKAALIPLLAFLLAIIGSLIAGFVL